VGACFEDRDNGRRHGRPSDLSDDGRLDDGHVRPDRRDASNGHRHDMRTGVTGLETDGAGVASADILMERPGGRVGMGRGPVVVIRMIVLLVAVHVQHPQRARGRQGCQREDDGHDANHPASV
jgi:hypothetical protein